PAPGPRVSHGAVAGQTCQSAQAVPSSVQSCTTWPLQRVVPTWQRVSAGGLQDAGSSGSPLVHSLGVPQFCKDSQASPCAHSSSMAPLHLVAPVSQIGSPDAVPELPSFGPSEIGKSSP